MTIVLTTHYMGEADSMAERVVIVDRGEVIADGTAEALKAKLAGDRLVVTAVTAAPGQPRGAHCLAQLVARLPGSRDVTVDGTRVEAQVGDGPAALPELLRAAADAGVHVGTAQVHRHTLDDDQQDPTPGRTQHEYPHRARPDGERNPHADPAQGARPVPGYRHRHDA